MIRTELMEKLLEKKQREVDKDIHNLLSYKEDFASMLYLLPPIEDLELENISTYFWSNTWLNFPLDKLLITKLCNLFSEHNWEVLAPVVESWGVKIKCYPPRDANLRSVIELHFNNGRTGSSCVLQEIGEEIKTEKIYEVVCKDAAEEAL